MGKHDSCALMLMQKGANINVVITTSLNEKKSNEDKMNVFKYWPRHYEDKSKGKTYTLFQGLVQNDWLGLTFVAMEQMEKFGMSYAKAIEVAFHLQKLQFAKRLIEKQVSEEKLSRKVTSNRNLINSLAFECKYSTEKLLLHDVVDLLVNAGLRIDDPDDFGCTSLHYACLNQSLDLLEHLVSKLSKGEVTALFETPDNFSRMPLASLFWNCSDLSKKLVAFVLDRGANPNLMARMKPLSHLNSGYTVESQEVEYLDNPDKDHDLVCPLIIAIAHRHFDLIKVLLHHDGINANVTDSKGRTPLMHAVMTNDKHIVNLILDHPRVDLDAIDNDGLTATHHLISLSEPAMGTITYDNTQFLGLLIKAGSNISRDSLSTMVKMANTAGAFKIGAVLAKRADNLNSISEKDIYQPFNVVDGTNYGIDYFDVADDSLKMLKKLDREADKKQKENCIMDVDDNEEDMEVDEQSRDSSDSDNEVEDEKQEDGKPPRSCHVKDGLLHKDYTVVMFKVDVSIGAWGQYNFYRMQIWQEKGKV